MIKRYFFTGLILLLPFAISMVLIIWIVDLLTDPFLHLAKSALLIFTTNHVFFAVEHPTLTIFISRVFVLAFLFIFTLLLGFLARKYLFSSLFTQLQNLFLKIPIIRVIYKLSHDVTKATLNTDSNLFKQTVLVSFPHRDSLAIGLVTGEVPASFKTDPSVDVEIAVFVPTAPHPMSGFLLLTPQKFTKPIDLSTEEAFKYIISCGSMPNVKQSKPE